MTKNHRIHNGDSRRDVLITTGLICVASLNSAIAQESSQPSRSKLEEVVVTATRREESIYKVPVSVSAYSRDTLDDLGAKSVDDVLALTPGVYFNRFGNFNTTANIAIRGLQSTVGAFTTAVYIDDTPIQSRGNPNSLFNSTFPAVFDLERVEVLRGPQGTLFGAGSEGGNVRFITPDASLSESSGHARVEVSNTRSGDLSYEAGIAAGGPIIADKLGIRASGWYRKDGGFVDHINYFGGATIEADSNWETSKAGRVALNFAPNDWLSIKPSFFAQRLHHNDADEYMTEYLSDFKNARQVFTPGSDDFNLPALKVEALLGTFARLTSVTSYFDREARQNGDFTFLLNYAFLGDPYPRAADDFAPSEHVTEQRTFTQEIRLQSENRDSKWDWVIGAFYQRAKENDLQRSGSLFLKDFIETVFGRPLYQGLYSYYGNTQTLEYDKSLFGNVSYQITDKLKAAVGARVSRSEIDFRLNLDGPLNGGTRVVRGKAEETPVTPKFSLSYQADDRNLFYTTYAKGVRSGGANGSVPQTPQCLPELQELGLTSTPESYESDEAWSFEVGSKNRLFDGRLLIEASAYHIDWNNLQQRVPLSCGANFITNVGSADSNGFELALQAQVMDALLLAAAVGYVDIEYAETVSSGDRTIVIEDTAVALLPQAPPPWSVTVTAEYSFTGFGGREMYLRAVDEYHSENSGPFGRYDPTNISFAPDLKPTPSTNVLNLRAGIEWSGIDISVFVNNVLDEDTDLNLTNVTTGSPLFTASTFRPRTVGLTASYKY